MAKRAEDRKYHYVYLVTRFDGKYYHGMHSTDDLEDGYQGSGTYLKNSVRYHGQDKHSMQILEFLPTRQAAKDREKELIKDENRFNDPRCMNLAPGGGGGFINEEHMWKAVNASRGASAASIKLKRQLDPDYNEWWSTRQINRNKLMHANNSTATVNWLTSGTAAACLPEANT